MKAPFFKAFWFHNFSFAADARHPSCRTAVTRSAASKTYHISHFSLSFLSFSVLLSPSFCLCPMNQGSGPLDLGPAPLRLGTCTASWTKGLLFTQAGALPFVSVDTSGAPWVLPFTCCMQRIPRRYNACGRNNTWSFVFFQTTQPYPRVLKVKVTLKGS